MDFWITISFFFGGAILGRFISRVVGISHASLAYEELDKSVLSMLIAVDKDISSALSTKYRALDAAEIPADVISRIKKIDERTITNWRDVVINRVISSLPPSFYRYVKYRNWEEAKSVAQKRRDRDNG